MAAAAAASSIASPRGRTARGYPMHPRSWTVGYVRSVTNTPPRWAHSGNDSLCTSEPLGGRPTAPMIARRARRTEAMPSSLENFTRLQSRRPR
jgi:hypothetical protein